MYDTNVNRGALRHTGHCFATHTIKNFKNFGCTIRYFIFILIYIIIMRILFTSGTFDCFHYGHLSILERAKALCDVLIVGVNSDKSVLERKNRIPQLDQNERLYIVSSIPWIFASFIHEPSQNVEVANYYNAFFILGDDYVNMYDDDAFHRGVCFLPRSPSISTTDLLSSVVKPKRKVILFDLDNVIVDWESAFFTKFPHLERSKRLNGWDIYDCFPDENLDIMNDNHFYLNMHPKPGALEMLDIVARLHQYEIFIVSSPARKCHQSASDKLTWILNNLGSAWVERTILTFDKTRVIGDFLVDDKPNITGSIESPTWKQIVFGAVYNQSRVSWDNLIYHLMSAS